LDSRRGTTSGEVANLTGPRTGRDRAQRADARANREHILDVAETVFGKGGESASTEEVARRAGVGVATVFRHFPNKAVLLEAVLTRRFDRLRERAEALLEAPNPGAAFFEFFRRLVVEAPPKIAIGKAFLEAGGERDGDVARASDGLRRAVDSLLDRAQQAGAVRTDIDLPAVCTLLVAASHMSAHIGLPTEVKDRALAIVLDGLAVHQRTFG
jgi:AcrR family transcriptional regulator